MKCRLCGAEIYDPNAKECPSCGMKIERATFNSDSVISNEHMSFGGGSQNQNYFDSKKRGFINKTIEAYKNMWINGLNFSGRTSRNEYWYCILFQILLGVVLRIIVMTFSRAPLESLGDSNIPILLYNIASFIPGLAMDIRRGHDMNKSAIFTVIMYCIPIIGWLVLLILFAEKSNPGENRFGPEPDQF